MDIEELLASYPRTRPPLSDAHRRIHRHEYQLNREARTLATRLSHLAESWMHRVVARNATQGSVLELGAGTLNHVPYEATRPYDVVEPFEALYAGSPWRASVRHVFGDVSELPPDLRYDRVLSIAVLEHLEQLPRVVAQSALRLEEGGRFQHCIPSDGALLWELGWRLTTGIAYRLRNRLSYAVVMRHEHINRTEEIVAVIAWFFERVRIERFPLPWHALSLYTYVEASAPRLQRCRGYLER